jgi:hypothetical protein
MAAGKITPQKGQQFISMLPADDAGMPKFQADALHTLLTAAQKLEQHLTPQDTGAGGQIIATSKYAGGGPAQVVPGSQFTKTATIADQLARQKFDFEKANPGFELKESEDGTMVGVNKRTLQAFPVTMGGAAPATAPAAGGPRVPPTATAAPNVQVIPGMNSVLDQPAATVPPAGAPLKGKGTALTESQGNATAYGMRMFESNRLINELEKGGTVSSGRIKGAVENALKITPFIGENLSEAGGAVMNVLPGVLGGPNAKQQEYDQAKRNFISAVLRKESGAAISQAEFANEEKKYFPQAGESESTSAQKQRARALAIEAMKIQAGVGSKHIGGSANAAPGAADPLGLRGR